MSSTSCYSEELTYSDSTTSFVKAEEQNEHGQLPLAELGAMCWTTGSLQRACLAVTWKPGCTLWTIHVLEA